MGRYERFDQRSTDYERIRLGRKRESETGARSRVMIDFESIAERMHDKSQAKRLTDSSELLESSRQPNGWLLARQSNSALRNGPL